ncbi:MAG: SLC13 family permease [Candidatus Limivicinus sp.]|jgi:di/tricarboxylate transporter
MESTVLSVILILSIAVAVYLGYRTKINTGLFCMVFAYLIGCFWIGLKPKALIAYWPTKIMFVILAVSLFYNVAASNGTLEKISKNLLYGCRRVPGMLPYALFCVAVILSVMGAAYFTVLAFLAPITMLICDESKMDKLTGAIAINCGALAGGDFPTAALGVIFRGLMDSSYEETPELTPIDSFSSTFVLFGLAIVSSLILITVFRFAIKANRNIGKGVTFTKPEPYNKQQKQTLTLIIIMMVIVLLFPLLKLLLPNVEIIGKIAGKIDVGLVAIIFAVIALLMKLAPQKEIISKVPWNTIIMIAGAGMLIAVAVEAGTIDMLSAWIGENIPAFLIPFMFGIVAAFMSFFSSTTGVVAPALFPLIPALATSVGINPAVLFTCTVLGAQSSAISPFSSGGSLVLSGCTNEEQRGALFNRLLFVGVPVSIGCCAVYNIIVSLIL